MRADAVFCAAACLVLAGHAAAADVAAAAAGDFLDSMGINLHVDQDYDPQSYVEPLRYTGVREVRDGERHVDRDIAIHRQTGVRFVVNGGGDLDGLLSAGRALSSAGALLALEGPNEPGNFPIRFNGTVGGGDARTWLPVARFQTDLYTLAKTDRVLERYPVFGVSETGAEIDDVGLQFLVVPPGAATALPAGSRLSDYLNEHNYVIGKGDRYTDNQAWNAADPALNGRWDGAYGNNALTWRRHYSGYDPAALQALPRVTTETGWDTAANPGGQRIQGVVLTNTYLAQFKRGWAYTFVYELRDGEGGKGSQGIYSGSAPKLAATYIHNLTTILADPSRPARQRRLGYAIAGQPATVHDLLLAKSSGQFDLVIWDERVSGEDAVRVSFAGAHHRIRIYDITEGTAPIRTAQDKAEIDLGMSDHALVLAVDD